MNYIILIVGLICFGLGFLIGGQVGWDSGFDCCKRITFMTPEEFLDKISN